MSRFSYVLWVVVSTVFAFLMTGASLVLAGYLLGLGLKAAGVFL